MKKFLTVAALAFSQALLSMTAEAEEHLRLMNSFSQPMLVTVVACDVPENKGSTFRETYTVPAKNTKEHQERQIWVSDMEGTRFADVLVTVGGVELFRSRIHTDCDLIVREKGNFFRYWHAFGDAPYSNADLPQWILDSLTVTPESLDDHVKRIIDQPAEESPSCLHGACAQPKVTSPYLDCFSLNYKKHIFGQWALAHPDVKLVPTKEEYRAAEKRLRDAGVDIYCHPDDHQ